MAQRGRLYRVRRKIQVLATKATSYEFMSRVYYYIKFRKKLDLNNPRTFNEKIQWLKLKYYPYNDDVIRCTDKYKVREYLEEKEKGEYLNQLIGVWDKWQDVDWDELPQKFALKCNHGCGYNIICDNKMNLSKLEAGKKINKWLSEDFSLFNAEQHYTSINPKIICEEYLGEDITDYKFFCFHGKPEFFYIAQGFGHGINERMTFFNIDGSKADFTRKEYKEFEDVINMPKNLEEMVELSRVLSSNFPFVRVDLFEIEGRVIFSEMTFTPGGGLMTIHPETYNEKWGSMINIDQIINQDREKRYSL